MGNRPRIGEKLVSKTHKDDIELSSIYEVHAGGFGLNNEFIETYRPALEELAKNK